MGVLTLGSASPRRLELLKRFNIDIIVKPAYINEIIDENLTSTQNALKISNDKLDSIKIENPNDSFILTADTFISLNGNIYGKPNDKNEAFNMLKALSGVTHDVITGVSMYSKTENKTISEACVTKVTFKELTSIDISNYLSYNEWQDAAGAYQIQNMGEILIEKINGSYSAVMGLPISLIYGMFVSLNFINPVI